MNVGLVERAARLARQCSVYLRVLPAVHVLRGADGALRRRLLAERFFAGLDRVVLCYF